ncbi:NADH dehydrogenase [ubiquinone] 1 alpha subcomplex subunit 3 [Camelus ferus]|nr:NADH dehydrogenase [ubiquinone] 1 alpha subcomplex subunit 3 [Camelus ferus]
MGSVMEPAYTVKTHVKTSKAQHQCPSQVLCAPAVAATATKTKRAARIPAFLKNAEDKELLLMASFTMGGLTIILPTLSPYAKYTIMINEATPCNYPVPLQDNRNTPDVPSHPQDP